MTDELEPVDGVNVPDGFRLLAGAGDGARSVWYRAEQIRLEREVGIKFLKPFLAESPAFREQFVAAGRQAAVIVHPAALSIINIFPAHNCIVRQWCPGESLKTLGPSLSPLKAASVGEAVMDCLAALHATDRCHGNLSPGNIFVDDERGVWVDDFFQPHRMSDGMRLYAGEQRYMAPEQLAAGAADWRTDVFSLGVILAECLDMDLLDREVAGVLDGIRARDPARRGESPQAVRDAFRRLRHVEEVRAGVVRATRIRRKRMYRRVPGEFAVALRRRSATPDETASILMKIRDIGESGVFVETDDELIGIGSILELDFTLKGAEDNVHAFGVVRWKSSPPMPKGVGVQFMEVDQVGLARLRKFLENK